MPEIRTLLHPLLERKSGYSYVVTLAFLATLYLAHINKSLLFIVLILVLATLPCHFYLARQIEPAFGFSETGPFQVAVRSWLIAGSLVSLGVGTLAALLPMWIGIRTFRRQEFH